MEKAFNLVQVSDNFKTDYANHFLKNEANYWWESTRALEGEGPVPWARFTKLYWKNISWVMCEVKWRLSF